MRISDWSSDVCSSDLEQLCGSPCERGSEPRWYDLVLAVVYTSHFVVGLTIAVVLWLRNRVEWKRWMRRYVAANLAALVVYVLYPMAPPWLASNEGRLESEVLRITARGWDEVGRSEEHTSELQSLMRISYAVFCLKKKNTKDEI